MSKKIKVEMNKIVFDVTKNEEGLPSKNLKKLVRNLKKENKVK